MRRWQKLSGPRVDSCTAVASVQPWCCRCRRRHRRQLQMQSHRSSRIKTDENEVVRIHNQPATSFYTSFSHRRPVAQGKPHKMQTPGRQTCAHFPPSSMSPGPSAHDLPNSHSSRSDFGSGSACFKAKSHASRCCVALTEAFCPRSARSPLLRHDFTMLQQTASK